MAAQKDFQFLENFPAGTPNMYREIDEPSAMGPQEHNHFHPHGTEPSI